MKEEQDLTTGNAAKKLLRFALPLLLGNLLQSFYSIVDMLVVGRMVGETGLAAVSNASVLSFIINSICIGVTMGGTVLVAQYKGANDAKGQRETIGTLFSVALVASLLVTILGLLAYRPLFEALHVPAASLQDACDYMRVVCYGTVFVFGYNAVCSVMKGFGDSQSALSFIAVATVANILLDIGLVGFFAMGTKGAAYATVVSQGISCLTAMLHLRRKSPVFAFALQNFAIKPDKLTGILQVGLPTAMQMVVVNLSYLLITGMLNAFGVSVAAAFGVGLKVNTFAGMPCWAVGQAVTAMVGQNMGAMDIERVKATTKIGLRLNLLLTLIAVVFVQIFARQIMLLFAPANAEVIEDGILYLRLCCGLNSLAYAALYTFDSFAIGVGAAHVAMRNALLDAVVVRLPASWLLAFALHGGSSGVYIGQALSPLLPAILGWLYFKSGVWERNNLLRRAEKEGE